MAIIFLLGGEVLHGEQYILVHSFNTVYVKDIRREISVMSRYTALKTGKNGIVFRDNFASS